MNHGCFVELYDFAREMQLLSWKLWTIRAYNGAEPPEFFPDLSGVVGDATPIEDLLSLFQGPKEPDGLAFFRDTFRKQGAFDPAVAIEELMTAIREKSWVGLLLDAGCHVGADHGTWRSQNDRDLVQLPPRHHAPPLPHLPSGVGADGEAGGGAETPTHEKGRRHHCRRPDSFS